MNVRCRPVQLTYTQSIPFQPGPRYLAEEIGRRATQETAKAQAVPAWTETKRDFENFAKRKGDLPLQQEGEAIDFRSVLHRCVGEKKAGKRLLACLLPLLLHTLIYMIPIPTHL